MSSTISPLVHEFFEQNPFGTFELVAVLDIQNDSCHYIVVFENIKTKWLGSALITPELLRTKYRPGFRYKNGKRIYSPGKSQKALIPITTSSSDKLITLSDVFDKNEILDNSYYDDFLLKQYAYKIDFPDYILIIPCYTVAARYYFLSSSMKSAIHKGKLEELYYRIYPVENNEVKIHIKTKAAKKDIPFICRFLLNPYAKSRWQYIAQQLTSQKEYAHLRAFFPVNDSFEILVRYKEISSINHNKPIRFVTSIMNDSSLLGFSKVIYKRFSTKTDPKSAKAEEYLAPKRNVFKTRSPAIVDNTIRTSAPASGNELQLFIETVEKDMNTLNLIIEGQNEYLGTTVASSMLEQIPDSNGFSFADGKHDGDKEISPAVYSETCDSRNQLTTLEDFLEFYYELITYPGVFEVSEPVIFEIDKILNESGKSYRKYSYIPPDHARYFLFAILAYDNKYIYLVEIQHDHTWTPSTWFFIANDLESVLEADIFKKIIEFYIDESCTYKHLKQKIKEEKNLKFEWKVHHQNKDDIAIESWCDKVIGKFV